jgi:SAM-dependent methyltransferase
MPRVDNDHFYKSALAKYGYNAKGLNWNSTQTQQTRFDVILSLLPKNISDCTIVDAGCGLGDFYLFLQDKNIQVGNYVGYDMVDDFIEYAKANTGRNIQKVNIISDELQKADYYIASGSLNILKPFEMVMFVKKCLDRSQKGFIFNFLEGEDRGDTFNYSHRDTIVNYIRNDCKYYRIKDGYLSNDVTIALYKNL